MDLPKIPTGMFDDLKSRFIGQGKQAEYDEAYDDYDDYDEYLDYGEYGYDEERDGGYAPASSEYDPYGSVTTRAAGAGRMGTSPNLVSISDVKRSAVVTESMGRDSLSSRTATGRTLVANTGPAPSSPAATMGEQSESLEAVFAPTVTKEAVQPAPVAEPAAAASSYDPYTAFTSASVASHKPTRSCVVMRPKVYGDAEKVAKTLRAGDVAVLCLAETPDTLVKRILDFSFGAAAALGASVDCVADKVFVVAVGPGLDDQERRGLQSQGVL
ncbi:MAG: cell division protein SepF [Coriobacteriia bacterium]|nr:cell division protein SepF [Coriobacteriia bacterium]